jgi:hypothetical protein
MKSENALWIWLCRILGPLFGLLLIYGTYDEFGHSKDMADLASIAITISGFLVLLVICGVTTFYGYKNRTKEQMQESYEAAANSIKDGVTIAAVATAAVIDEEMKKKERNKPLTKGDLEDLKAELRRKERGY